MSSGATLMAFDGFTFWKDNRKEISNATPVNWYCSSKRQGNCRVTLKGLGLHILESRGQHNHARPVLVTDPQGKYHKFNPARAWRAKDY